MNNVKTKSFSHNIIDVNTWFNKKNAEILSAGEKNDDYLLQLFNCYLTCPVKAFVESINEEKRKYDRENIYSAKI